MNVLDHSISFESELLRTLARDATKSSSGFGAITAAIMAFAAIEAFMNEVGQLAQTELRRNSDPYAEEYPQQLKDLALALKVARENKASTTYQYDLAREILEGHPPERSGGSRQDLDTLRKLRNALVHMQSPEVEIYLQPPEEENAEGDVGTIVSRHEQPKFMRALESKGLLDYAGDDTQWSNLICTTKLADWVCDTVEQAAHELVERAPEDTEFRTQLEGYSLGGTLTRARNPSRFGLLP